MNRLAKESGHSVVLAAGPVNHPYIKFFQRADSAKFEQNMQQYNFDRVQCFALWWFASREAAGRWLAALNDYFAANYPTALGGGFYRFDDGEFGLTLAVDHAGRLSGELPFTADERETFLMSEAARIEGRLMAEAEKWAG